MEEGVFVASVGVCGIGFAMCVVGLLPPDGAPAACLAGGEGPPRAELAAPAQRLLPSWQSFATCSLHLHPPSAFCWQ